MLEKLKHAQEIAVDLEWHGYRSFQGFLCLMQLSTREEDWIVDLLALRQTKGGHEALEEMGEIFADPNIVKVRVSFKGHPSIPEKPMLYPGFSRRRQRHCLASTRLQLVCSQYV